MLHKYGLLADVRLPDHALDFTYVKKSPHSFAVRVLLGNGKDMLCNQPLYCAHVLSLEATAEVLNEQGTNANLRRGRVQPRACGMVIQC